MLPEEPAETGTFLPTSTAGENEGNKAVYETAPNLWSPRPFRAGHGVNTNSALSRLGQHHTVQVSLHYRALVSEPKGEDEVH